MKKVILEKQDLLVRKEWLVFFHTFVNFFRKNYIDALYLVTATSAWKRLTISGFCVTKFDPMPTHKPDISQINFF